MSYEVITMTPEEYLAAFLEHFGTEDAVLCNDGDGYYFTDLDGNYNTDEGVYVPEHILEQPWSYPVDELEQRDPDDLDEVYVHIEGDDERLYEHPDPE